MTDVEPEESAPEETDSDIVELVLNLKKDIRALTLIATKTSFKFLREVEDLRFFDQK
jgi:hypothetical protein